MKWFRTDGWMLGDLAAEISMSKDTTLADDEKRPFINFTCSAASKTLTLGLDVGDTAIVTNIGGTNAVTVKNVAGDTGTSVAAGKTALVVASKTADASTVLVLN